MKRKDLPDYFIRRMGEDFPGRFDPEDIRRSLTTQNPSYLAMLSYPKDVSEEFASRVYELFRLAIDDINVRNAVDKIAKIKPKINFN